MLVIVVLVLVVLMVLVVMVMVVVVVVVLMAVVLMCHCGDYDVYYLCDTFCPSLYSRPKALFCLAHLHLQTVPPVDNRHNRNLVDLYHTLQCVSWAKRLCHT